jgi:hypothetical protein
VRQTVENLEHFSLFIQSRYVGHIVLVEGTLDAWSLVVSISGYSSVVIVQHIGCECCWVLDITKIHCPVSCQTFVWIGNYVDATQFGAIELL